MKPSLQDAVFSRAVKTHLEKSQQDSSGDEQRVFRRHGVSFTVLVQPVADENAALTPSARPAMVSAVVTNVSLSGLVFVSPHTYPTGSVVEVQISLGAQVYLLRAVVRRTQVLALPGRRAFQCAAQLARGDEAARFIPAMAKYLHHRFGSSAARVS